MCGAGMLAVWGSPITAITDPTKPRSQQTVRLLRTSLPAAHWDVATFIDNSDPIQIVITSTGGDVFKNGQGSTVLTAVCYQAGAEIDSEGNSM